MVTVIAAPGQLRTALLQRFEARAQAVHVYDSASDDLFLLAMNSRAIVYACTDGAAPETFYEMLRAMGAPGARRLVLVSSSGIALDTRLPILRKRGVPYVVLKTPRLLEDALDDLASVGSTRIWVPGDFKLVAASAATIADAILDALASDSDGGIVEVAAETLGAAEVAARLRMRPSVQASTLPKVLYRLGERLGAIAGADRSRPFFDRTAA